MFPLQFVAIGHDTKSDFLCLSQSNRTLGRNPIHLQIYRYGGAMAYLKMTTLPTTRDQMIETGVVFGIGLILLGLILVVLWVISASESPISAEEFSRLRQYSWPSPRSPIPLIHGV